MDASERLGWIDLVKFIFILAIFHGNSQKAIAGERFERHSWGGVKRADSQNDIVSGVDAADDQNNCRQNTSSDLRARHAGSIAEESLTTA